MLGSFEALNNRAFMDIPPQMLDFFNRSSPEGYSYQFTSDDHSVCHLLPTNDDKAVDPPSFSGVRLSLSDRQRRELGEYAEDADAIRNYIDNSLDEFQLDVSNAKALFGDVEIPFSEMAKRVDDSLSAVKSVTVSHKPVKTLIPFKCDDETTIVLFRQVRSGEPYVRKLESVDYPLRMRMSVDLKALKWDFSCSFDRSLGQSSAQCYEAARLYRGIVNGDAEMGGSAKMAGGHDDTAQRIAGSWVHFWKRAAALEGPLGVSFVPGGKLNSEDVRAIERLYEGIVLGRSVELGYRPESLSYEPAKDETLPEHTKMRLTIPETEEFEILGATFAVSSIVGLSGISLSDPVYEESGNVTFSIQYSEESLCRVLYLIPGPTDDSVKNMNRIDEILFESQGEDGGLEGE